jgi:hypothetical protein
MKERWRVSCPAFESSVNTTSFGAERAAGQLEAQVEQSIETRLAHVSGEQWRGAMLALGQFLPDDDPREEGSPAWLA